jgi:membrane protease YdiL (CAAX protease family)
MRLKHQRARQPAHPVNVGKSLLGRSHRESIRYNIRLPSARQLGLFPTLGVWVALCAVFILFALSTQHASGLGGRAFVSSLLAFSLLLGVMLLFAARGSVEQFSSITGPGAAWLLAVILFFFFLIYALGTGTGTFLRLSSMAAFLFGPLLILATAQNAGPGAWQDFLTLTAVWATVKFGPSHWLWPDPGGRLAYIFTVVIAVNIAIAGFLLLRQVKNSGYAIGWGSGWSLHILGALTGFAVIAIPLGLKFHFLVYAPKISEWESFVPLSIAILVFTAWPEEFLFRGLLQNLLSRSTNSETAGWLTASILFGFSHITNMHFPNWRYVLLATIAGLFYGWTWRKTGSIFASAIVHATVDILWHFLFVTP